MEHGHGIHNTLDRNIGTEELEKYKVERYPTSNESVMIPFVPHLNWSEFIVGSMTGIFLSYKRKKKKEKNKPIGKRYV